MGGSSGPSAPAAATVPPPIPTVQTPAQIKAATSTQQRAQAAIGPAGTIETSPNGVLQQASTGAKTLLGS